MIRITGVGNGKNVIFDLIKSNGKDIQLVQYDSKKINQAQDQDDILFIIYDGLCINEFLEFAPLIKKVRYVPIFLTATNFYVFGINELKNDRKKTNVCPVCVTKNSMNKLFKLNLYTYLIKQRGFKSYEKSYGKELNHFLLLVLEMIDKNELNGYSFSYLIQANTYSKEKITGLSRCSTCDNTDYDNNEMQNFLKEVL